MHFTFDNPGSRVVFGAGSAASVGDEVERLGCQRVLVVSTPGRLEAFPALPANLVTGTFVEAVQHVPVDVAQRARDAARESRADCVVAIGGGSSIGVAKAIALEIPLPIIAVPTTYGGSEMTSIWGITRDGQKETGRDPSVRPAVSIYDPDLTLDMPRASSEPGRMDNKGDGLFRGRFATTPGGHAANTPVIGSGTAISARSRPWAAAIRRLSSIIVSTSGPASS